MNKFLLTLLSSLLLLVSAQAEVEFFHTQDKVTLGSTIKESLQQAKESILILTFSLSDSDVIRILNEKAESGLKVTLVVDKDHLTQVMVAKHPTIEVVTRRHGEGHLHHKILVVDHQEIWLGSANFTKAAFSSQDNFMVRFFSDELAALLEEEVDVFRAQKSRVVHGPLPIIFADQMLYFCHLPHEGFPALKVERAINVASKNFLLEKIQNAKFSLKIAMSVWTNADLTYAVLKAYARGVDVQVVSQDMQGSIADLKRAGISVTVNSKLTLMHNKMMSVDDQIFVVGSPNWSQSSFTRSDESFVVIEPILPHQLLIIHDYWNYLRGN